MLDQLGNLINYTTYGGVQNDDFKGVCLSPDGEFVMAGTRWYSVLNQENSIYVVKSNLTGNSVWEEEYGDFNGLQYGNDICRASDGGYVICGQKVYLSSELVIIKINENGTTVSTIELPSFNNFSIYPNPIVDYTTVDFGEPLLEGGQLEIYTTSGQLVYSKELTAGIKQYKIDRGNLSSGMYLLSVRSGVFSTTRRIMIR